MCFCGVPRTACVARARAWWHCLRVLGVHLWCTMHSVRCASLGSVAWECFSTSPSTMSAPSTRPALNSAWCARRETAAGSLCTPTMTASKSEAVPVSGWGMASRCATRLRSDQLSSLPRVHCYLRQPRCKRSLRRVLQHMSACAYKGFCTLTRSRCAAGSSPTPTFDTSMQHDTGIQLEHRVSSLNTCATDLPADSPADSPADQKIAKSGSAARVPTNTPHPDDYLKRATTATHRKP